MEDSIPSSVAESLVSDVRPENDPSIIQRDEEVLCSSKLSEATDCGSKIDSIQSSILESSLVESVPPEDEATPKDDEMETVEDVGIIPEITVKIEDSYQFVNSFVISNGSLDGDKGGDYFLKGCKWSPDGSCLLTASDDNTLRLFDFPSQFYNVSEFSKPQGEVDSRPPSLKVVEAGQIYDYAWYPFMSSWDPATSCFLTSASNCPVHLWDAFTGNLRASYRAYNFADEVTSVYSVAFSVTGDKIFAGIKNQVRIFDVSKPGRECVTVNLKEIGNQRGMMSCVVNNPVMTDMFAVGSYRKSIGLYLMDGGYVCTFMGHQNGLTQLSFSKDGSLLFSSARRDSRIVCWDLRKPGDALFVFNRPHSTNQRIYFHLSPNDDYFISGSTDGNVYIWDLRELSKTDISNTKVSPRHIFLAHNDCTNGVSLHPKQQILATASGQRHYPDLISDDENPKIFCDNSVKDKSENSVKMWWIGPIRDESM